MAEDDSFIYHEVAFFPIQYKAVAFEKVAREIIDNSEGQFRFVCEGPLKGQVKCLYLDLQGDRDLKWKLIFPGCVVQLTIVNTYAPSGDCPLRDELVLLILYYGHSSLLWDNLDRTYPRTSILHHGLMCRPIVAGPASGFFVIGIHIALVVARKGIPKMIETSSSSSISKNTKSNGKMNLLIFTNRFSQTPMRLREAAHPRHPFSASLIWTEKAGKGGSCVLIHDLVVMAKVGASGSGVLLLLIVESLGALAGFGPVVSQEEDASLSKSIGLSWIIQTSLWKNTSDSKKKKLKDKVEHLIGKLPGSGKMGYYEDLSFTDVETEYPAIVLDDISDAAFSRKPTVSPLDNNEIDFNISFDESDDEDYMLVFNENSFPVK
ncbi:hypothetical protein Tco_1446821 [Tanacetum coccineum]